MPECDNCGKHVSKKFMKVFSNNSGELGACPDCGANAGIAEQSQNRI